MKPFGREKKVKGASWKKDIHPKKGLVNWWETICKCVSRKTMKQRWRKSPKIFKRKIPLSGRAG